MRYWSWQKKGGISKNNRKGISIKKGVKTGHEQGVIQNTE